MLPEYHRGSCARNRNVGNLQGTNDTTMTIFTVSTHSSHASLEHSSIALTFSETSPRLVKVVKTNHESRENK